MAGQENQIEEDLAFTDDSGWAAWATAHGVEAPKLAVRATTPEERGKGGVYASDSIAAMEVIARIPRKLVLCPDEDSAAVEANAKEVCEGLRATWVTELTAAALMRSSVLSLSSQPEDGIFWSSGGGWATDAADLGGEGGRWGARDVIGTLMATGSDNDKNIYAKFRFPCHPVVHRAGIGLAALTGTKEGDARDALVLRGKCFRAIREALIPLIEEPTTRWGRGSARDRRSWDIADTLSRVLSRATLVDLADDGVPTAAIVPLHERLAHCDSRGENAKLVGRDPSGAVSGAASGRDDVLLVATRPIQQGEPISRDYEMAPRLPCDESSGALRLLLQFGLPYAAWP